MPDPDRMNDTEKTAIETPEAPLSTLSLTSDQAEKAGIVAAEPGTSYELTVTVTITSAGDGITADVTDARDALETSESDEPEQPVTPPPATRPLPRRLGPKAFGMAEGATEE